MVELRKKRYVRYQQWHMSIVFADSLSIHFPGKEVVECIEGKNLSASEGTPPCGNPDEGDDMRVLKFVWKCWCRLWRSRQNLPTGINSHKWESKIEILRHLSRRRH